MAHHRKLSPKKFNKEENRVNAVNGGMPSIDHGGRPCVALRRLWRLPAANGADNRASRTSHGRTKSS
jgi:hypothetical protein